DTYLRLATHLEDYREDGNARGWLLRTAFNLGIGAYRKRRGRAPLDPEAHAAGGEGPLEGLLRGEQVEGVREALAALPAPYRQVLLLRFAEGLCYEDIAERLKLSTSTVWRRAGKALAALRSLLAPEGGGRPA